MQTIVVRYYGMHAYIQTADIWVNHNLLRVLGSVLLCLLNIFYDTTVFAQYYAPTYTEIHCLHHVCLYVFQQLSTKIAFQLLRTEPRNKKQKPHNQTFGTQRYLYPQRLYRGCGHQKAQRV